jgi:16S rRNA (cytosine1402-N4)-methyltransferase
MKKQKQTNHILHSPVLADEVLAILEPNKDDTYLDLTAGYGGHAEMILKKTGNYKASVLCDRDQEAIDHVSDLFSDKGTQMLRENFSKGCDVLLSKGRAFDIILADLGVSSPHLDKANRGFSILRDGPLDMRMDQGSGRTAGDLVNFATEQELETILRVYGEEPKAKKIAHALLLGRPFSTTSELAECIKQVYGIYTKHHPAVRSFQALRIAVNDELSLLTDMLPKAISLLTPGGRLGVITFHSLEDRIVKQFFADHASAGYEATVTLLTKKPITASDSELSFNPRARSAKLRAVSKK